MPISSRRSVYRVALLLPILLTACASDEAEWALDSVYLEPSENGVYGFQTWNLYRKAFQRKQHERTFVCAIVVELEGRSTGCPSCTHAWSTETSLLETDCTPEQVENPVFLSLSALGVGEFAPEGPHASLTSLGWVDYGYGWEEHGWAYPSGLDQGQAVSDAGWDGEQPFTFLPTAAWPLTE
jgi:hypothetical protein